MGSRQLFQLGSKRWRTLFKVSLWPRNTTFCLYYFLTGEIALKTHKKIKMKQSLVKILVKGIFLLWLLVECTGVLGMYPRNIRKRKVSGVHFVRFVIGRDYNTVDGRRFWNTNAPSTVADSKILVHRWRGRRNNRCISSQNLCLMTTGEGCASGGPNRTRRTV